jgi:hypothetical protein
MLSTHPFAAFGCFNGHRVISKCRGAAFCGEQPSAVFVGAHPLGVDMVFGSWYTCKSWRFTMPVLSLFYGIIVRMEIHRDDLAANWELLSGGEQYFKIEPLK